MMVLYIAAGVALVASVIASREKTWAALRLAGGRFIKILPAFGVVMALFSVAIVLLPEEVIREVLGRESGWRGVAVAAAVGSLTLMPGFIAFPLCGALLKQGVPYMVLSAFSTTLMSVGVLTYPLERQYFGRGVTVVRNGISLLIALLVALVTGLVFREIAV